LDKAQWRAAVADFKAYQADPANKPSKNSEGTKEAGNVPFVTYLFYAMLRGKSPEKASHDPQGKTYKNALLALAGYAKNGHVPTWVELEDSWRFEHHLVMLSQCFSSLSKTQIRDVIIMAINEH
jgi:hypothetical protein